MSNLKSQQLKERTTARAHGQKSLYLYLSYLNVVSNKGTGSKQRNFKMVSMLVFRDSRVEGYNENLLQINVHFKPISGHFKEKNNNRCQIS